MSTTRGDRVAGKVAIVTGAASGLGTSVARTLAREGAQVAVADLRRDPGQSIADDIGANACFVELDVTDERSWANAVASTEARFGNVTILVNNAGILDLGSLGEMTEAVYRRMIDVNQIGTFLGMQAAARSMRKAGGGSIVNISSAGGKVGLRHMGGYVSTKFAVRGLTKSAAIDLAEDNIRVNAVLPGAMDTPMNAGGLPPKLQAIKRFAHPDEMASMVLYLASDEASYCTGTDHVVDGGFLNVVGEILI